MKPDEHAFEVEICDWLVEHGGYDLLKVGNAQGTQPDFDPVRGLDTAELFAFIGATQPDEWNELVKLHGGADAAQKKFADRLAKELDAHGAVHVLRQGVVDLGVTIRLAYFRPANNFSAALQQRYAANRLTVTRQLPFEPGSNRTLDVALFVNGIPVATAELKNRLTGQSVEDAKEQYRSKNRDPKNVTLARRAVVHFAVDSEEVAMTTRLEGELTRFLPFNLGTPGGAGNPANPNVHRTSYLWQRVWPRDAWLDLLARYVHVEKPGLGSKDQGPTIFPRYHQWDAVESLVTAARDEGPGHDYLVQHSAGSGKSNTIAWLAHRLSSLHDASDSKVFDKVVVITDRKVLDRQLQDTIYQFEHAHGVVEKIDTNSAQLAEALAGQQARIIITTLQKFPVVLKQGVDLPGRRYAVIVDEAHSSQTGEASKDLKLVLNNGEAEDQLSAAEAEDNNIATEAENPAEEALAKAAAARGHQSNLSFFAFTATPKGRTLELFGRLDPETNRHLPFHLYSMRQAIAEGFILDTLANYTTYQLFFQLEKAIRDDPAYDSSKAKAAIARFVMLHEHNLAQKAEVIVEHFQQHVRHRVGNRAKAMVVTASRLHAVRYQQALKKYISEHGYDLGVLVAFSGSVSDGPADWTESAMNGVPDSQTVQAFNGPDNHLLVVAEKYQTGFDQPLLCAMYVDKVLTGLNAVQTLSRLNRIHPAKRQDDVFVLDFRNDGDAIRDAFEPWYGKTIAPPSDPNLLYDTRHALDEFGVLWPSEVEAFVSILLGPGEKGDHGRIHSLLAPSIDRFNALDEEERDRFRDDLNRFCRIYAFLSQIVSFTDVKLERDFLFCKALAAFLRPDNMGSFDLGTEVELTHLRLVKIAEGPVVVDGDEGEVTTIFSGTGKLFDPDEEPLSQIIAQINERFGTNFDPKDRVFYDTVADKLADRPDMQQAAVANTPDNFKLVLEKEFLGGVMDQLNVSEDLAIKYIDDADLQQLVLAAYLPLIQGKAKIAWQEHCPIGELLGPDRESASLEYKSTLRTHAGGPGDGEVFKPLETACLKSIAAFLNSRDGGTLLIGVADDGTVPGLGSDYASLRKAGKDDRDLFGLHLGNIVSQSMGDAAASNVTAQFHTIDGRDLCRVHVKPCGFPVDATVIVDRKGQFEKDVGFYIRVGNGTKKLDAIQREKYVATRWSS